jgi:hypothetical protein
MAEKIDTPVEQLKTARVQRAVKELNHQIEQALDHARQIRGGPRPSILAIDPGSGTIRSAVRLSVYGDNFQPGAEVRLTRPGPPEERITGKHVVVVSSKLVTAEFELTEALQEARGRVEKIPLVDKVDSSWTVVVINPDHQYDWREGVFILHAADDEVIEGDGPTIEDVTQSFDKKQARLRLEIRGKNLHPGRVEISSSGGTMSTTDVLVRPSTHDFVTAEFDGDTARTILKSALTDGKLMVTLTSVDGQPDTFTIEIVG